MSKVTWQQLTEAERDYLRVVCERSGEYWLQTIRHWFHVSVFEYSHLQTLNLIETRDSIDGSSLWEERATAALQNRAIHGRTLIICFGWVTRMPVMK